MAGPCARDLNIKSSKWKPFFFYGKFAFLEVMRLGRFKLCFKPAVDYVIFLTGRKQYEMSTHHPNPSHRPEPGFPMQIKKKCRFYMQGMVHVHLSAVLVWQGW